MKKNNVVQFAARARDTVKGWGAKVGTGAAALMASGAALASGGGTSPGSAIAAELSTGKNDVLLVVGAVAIILGVLVLWRYIKRAG